MLEVKLTGDKELVKIFDQLVDDYGSKEARKALRPVVEASLVGVEDQIRRTTPVDTTGLRDSTALVIGTPPTKKRRRDPHLVYEGGAGWVIPKDEPHPNWSQAYAVEYGTENRPGLHVIRKAFERHQQKMISIFEREFREHLYKRVRQLRVRHGVK